MKRLNLLINLCFERESKQRNNGALWDTTPIFLNHIFGEKIKRVFPHHTHPSFRLPNALIGHPHLQRVQADATSQSHDPKNLQEYATIPHFLPPSFLFFFFKPGIPPPPFSFAMSKVLRRRAAEVRTPPLSRAHRNINPGWDTGEFTRKSLLLHTPRPAGSGIDDCHLLILFSPPPLLLSFGFYEFREPRKEKGEKEKW